MNFELNRNEKYKVMHRQINEILNNFEDKKFKIKFLISICILIITQKNVNKYA
jgi:hypothetical protein